MFGPDQQAFMQQMKQALEESRKRLGETIVAGESGGGLIRVEMDGNRKLRSLQINTSLAEMEKEDLEDLLTVALQRALEEAERVNEREASSSARQFIPGL